MRIARLTPWHPAAYFVTSKHFNPHLLKQVLHRLWNFEFRQFKPWHYVLMTCLIVGVGTFYVFAEVLFGQHPQFKHFTLMNFWASLTQQFQLPDGPVSLKAVFPQLWISVALLCVSFRIAVIYLSYRKSKTDLGEKVFAHYFYTYFSAFLIGFGSSLLLIFLVSAVLVLAGVHIELGTDALASGVDWLHAFIDTHVPSIFKVRSYWLAIVITILLSGLPLYFVHWLSHKSRFFWYVFHRAHHCPQYLHPLASPPAFVFEFLLIVPYTLVAVVISKIVYTQPLVMEMALWFTFGYTMEIFNHSVAGYDFAYKNFIVRNLCRLYGDVGVYHLVHHSSIPGDEMVNLSSGPLQLWDRVFGTYRKPYKEVPPIGLTNNPKIRMNPFRIIFSGIAQLWYELKMNKSWATRWKVIFGGIYYKPPVTREFLILGYE